jgi:biotin synthase
MDQGTGEDLMAPTEKVRISLAAAMTIGLKRGLFHRNAKLGCINLLMEYDEGCLANCAYCGQGREMPDTPVDRCLIRVDWPTYPLDAIIEATREAAAKDPFIQRVCVSAISNPKAPRDLIGIVKRLREETDLKVSTLVTPTVFTKEDFVSIREAGAENISIAVDCASPELFTKLRGREVGSVHDWDRYLQGIRDAVEVMGDTSNPTGVHLIIGLGETEEEAARFIQQCYDMGARVHLFSFFPEPGSPMEDHPQPPMDNYRRVQLVRHLLDKGITRVDQMRFEGGDLVDFGIPPERLDAVIEKGTAFMTSGCPGCNRPYANETPTQAMEGLLRNYPFRPTEEDVALIKQQF